MKNISAFVAFRIEKKDSIVYHFLIRLKDKSSCFLLVDDWGLIFDSDEINLDFPCCLQIARFIKQKDE